MTPIRLVCPRCADDDLATIERIEGLAPAAFVINAEGEREAIHEGMTTVLWDTSESYGIHCRSCDWSVENAKPTLDGLMEFLLPQDDEEEEDDD